MKKILFIISSVIICVNFSAVAQTPPPLTIEAYDLFGSPLGNNPTICQSQSIDFNVQLPFEMTEPKISKWKKNGVTVLTQNAVNPSPPGISWNSSTLISGDVITLTVTFTSPPPFYSPDSVTSQNITFTVTPNQPPTVYITDNMLNDTICLGSPITFTATALEAGTPTYQWYLDGAPVGTASTYTTSVTLLSGNHNVWCEITSSEWCDLLDPVYSQWATSSQISFYVQPCTSVQEHLANATIMFFNPVTNQFTINDVPFTILEIGTYNVLGEKIFSQKPTAKSQEQIAIDVSALPSGIYFVKVKGEKEESVAKFIKQ